METRAHKSSQVPISHVKFILHKYGKLVHTVWLLSESGYTNSHAALSESSCFYFEGLSCLRIINTFFTSLCSQLPLFYKSAVRLNIVSLLGGNRIITHLLFFRSCEDLWKSSRHIVIELGHRPRKKQLKSGADVAIFKGSLELARAGFFKKLFLIKMMIFLNMISDCCLAACALKTPVKACQ